MTPKPPAGWYLRDGENEERWWDGESWTDAIKPLVADSPTTKRRGLDAGETFAVVIAASCTRMRLMASRLLMASSSNTSPTEGMITARHALSIRSTALLTRLLAHRCPGVTEP